jgi:hypothetical protein
MAYPTFRDSGVGAAIHHMSVGSSIHVPRQMTTSTTDKSLDRFLEAVRCNQQSNRKRFPERYRIIQRVDDWFARSGNHLDNAKPMFTGPMFMRSHYAYKAAAGMTLAGQFSESFVMMRSCLEYAGYVLLIFTNPDLEEVFLKRHVDIASKKAQRGKFEVSNVIRKIAGFDQKLSEVFKEMYDRSIDFGAHPNPHGIFGATNISKDENEQMTAMSTAALVKNPRVTEFAMHRVAQVGLTSLCVFQHVFTEKFEMLGMRAEMDALKEAGL